MIKRKTISLLLSCRYVPITRITNIFGHKFDQNHHLVSTAAQLIKDPSTNLKDTSLWRYHANFKPRSTNEAMCLQNLSRIYPIFEYPWGYFNLNRQIPKSVNKSRFCGPSRDNLVEEEFANLKQLVMSIITHGYKLISKKSLIFGTYIGNQNCKVFVPLQGNHRIAVLIALGHKYVFVGCHENYHRKISIIHKPRLPVELDHNMCVRKFVGNEI